MAEGAAAAKQGNSFVAELEASNLHPLWDRYQHITPIKPQPRDAPLLWRWQDIEPFLHRAVGEVAINDIERRALIMVHPAFGAETTTSSTLLAAFTVLDPGDRARPHRHTFAAIRFATRADGATTIVNGRRCDMRDGDLILTPPMCWHGHINESDHRIIWFDAANMPLIRALDANFFEPGDPATTRSGRSTRVRRNCDPSSACAPTAPSRAPSIRLSIAIPAKRRAGCSPPRPPARMVRARFATNRDRRRGDAHARLLRRAPAARTRHAAEARDLEHRLPRGRRRGPLHHRRPDLRLVAARRLHHPALDLRAHEARSADADLFIVTDKSAFERLDLVREELE